MNKIQVSICIILMFILSGCVLSLLDSYEEPEQAKFVGDILNNVSKKLQKKYTMRTIGTGIGMPDGVVTMLALSFEKTGPLTQEEGRAIIVGCVEEMIQTVNKNEKIRPYLENYPFTSNNVEIRLFLKTKEGNKIYEPDYGVISEIDGSVNYKYKSSENPKKYSKIEEEKFEEALKMVQNKSKK
ncbi:hypothetical protein [Neochlamydia sp. EPS4]|uniref:hypothetical protein n=1 Tax=Neochlamydia sp. EPS4 TaxID=1478175 RepID=UPI0005D11B04|nr:hypothetical protein [Neochlamydia sp. EPS4]